MPKHITQVVKIIMLIRTCDAAHCTWHLLPPELLWYIFALLPIKVLHYDSFASNDQVIPMLKAYRPKDIDGRYLLVGRE
jgi:hypothetical protein